MPVRDHFLDPVRIEPPADERRAERVRILLLEHRVEHFLPAANSPQRRLFHDAADAYRLRALAGPEAIELRAVLLAFPKGREQILRGPEPHPLEAARPQRREPAALGERRREV